MVIFPGTVIMWGLSVGEIPVGWALCDGTSGTPDLRDRFIYGASSSVAVGSTGGAATASISVNQMASHSHGAGSVTLSSAGSHQHTEDFCVSTFSSYFRGFGSFLGTGSQTHPNVGMFNAGSHTHTISGNTASVGSGDAHNNLPPYRAVLFIMKL